MIKECEVYIGIDCAPGMPRPETYTERVREILDVNTLGPVQSKLFGAWTWKLTVELESDDVDKKVQEIQEYFVSIYEKGFVRGTEHYIIEKD